MYDVVQEENAAMLVVIHCFIPSFYVMSANVCHTFAPSHNSQGGKDMERSAPSTGEKERKKVGASLGRKEKYQEGKEKAFLYCMCKHSSWATIHPIVCKNVKTIYLTIKEIMHP